MYIFYQEKFQGYCSKLKKKSINLSHPIKLLCVYKTAIGQLKTVVQDYNKSYSNVKVVYPSLYQYTVKNILPFLKCLTSWENSRNILNHRWLNFCMKILINFLSTSLTTEINIIKIFLTFLVEEESIFTILLLNILYTIICV